jgi:hypothetical protein
VPSQQGLGVTSQPERSPGGVRQRQRQQSPVLSLGHAFDIARLRTPRQGWPDTSNRMRPAISLVSLCDGSRANTGHSRTRLRHGWPRPLRNGKCRAVRSVPDCASAPTSPLAPLTAGWGAHMTTVESTRLAGGSGLGHVLMGSELVSDRSHQIGRWW